MRPKLRLPVLGHALRASASGDKARSSLGRLRCDLRVGVGTAPGGPARAHVPQWRAAALQARRLGVSAVALSGLTGPLARVKALQRALKPA